MEKKTLERFKGTDFAVYGVSSSVKGKAVDFISGLIDKGIPLSQIDISDWSSSEPAIYVTIPYGRTYGGRFRQYKRWSKKDILSAVKFYDNPPGR